MADTRCWGVVIKIKRILCPLDLSAISEPALRHSAALARWHEAERVTLRVGFVPAVRPPAHRGIF